MDTTVPSKHDTLVESCRTLKNDAVARYVIPGEAVVTSLCLSSIYIVVAMDNGKLYLFSSDGEYQTTLEGHTEGVWATALWLDTLVSGGVDRYVRVWNMATRKSVHVLSGHTSTIRCLKWTDSQTVISGSRDASLRVWNVDTGVCMHVLEGHRATVQCLDSSSGLAVSGSQDADCKVWSLSEGRCLKTLTGHTKTIYAIAFDGINIVTGSLDTNVRVWDAASGACTAVLEGHHTSLVSLVQMRGDTLATAGADGSLRVWSLNDLVTPRYSLAAAHENSVTDLQMHEDCIVSGGSDGRVRIWQLQTGELLKEVGDPSKAVWKVAFGKQNSVVVACWRGMSAVLEMYRSVGS